jgi:hypothetical protein
VNRNVLCAVMLAGLVACDRPTPRGGATSSSVASSAPVAPVATASAPAPAASRAPAVLPGLHTFDNAEIGGVPRGIEAVVGEWRVREVDGARGLEVDGTRWRQGTPSASLADQARRLYGDRYAEFLDGVKAFAFFPLAVVQEAPPPGNLRISVRFHPQQGQIDQAAGIAFGIGSDGSYWGVRANALEDNLLLFRVVKGKRTILETVRGTPTATRRWHTLQVTVTDRRASAILDGEHAIARDLDGPIPAGRVGLWSKADSKVLFDDLRIEPLPP